MTPILHATLVLEWEGTTIYVDPYGGAERFSSFKKADLILITHAHGDQEMTPVAKWVEFEDEGYYRSGNGWLQNEVGSWSLQDGQLKVMEENGILDPYGAFKVSASSEAMTWSRMEDGELVTVFLDRVYIKPMGPADQLKGLWVLEKVEHNGEDITDDFDPEHKYYMFFRWDRIYVEGDVDGKRYTGYWFMHGHRPELTIIPHGVEPVSEAWNISFSKGKLLMTAASEEKSGVVMRFSRSDRFPGQD